MNDELIFTLLVEIIEYRNTVSIRANTYFLYSIGLSDLDEQLRIASKIKYQN